MKTIKMFQIAAVMLVLSFAAGCGDQLISPTESVTTENQSMELKSAASGNEKNVFSAKIRIKPNQSFSFNYSNTGYYEFNLFSITNCDGSPKAFEVIGYSDDEQILLSCSSSGFVATSISIQNLASDILELDVVLSGSKAKPRDPKALKEASE